MIIKFSHISNSKIFPSFRLEKYSPSSSVGISISCRPHVQGRETNLQRKKSENLEFRIWDCRWILPKFTNWISFSRFLIFFFGATLPRAPIKKQVYRGTWAENPFLSRKNVAINKQPIMRSFAILSNFVGNGLSVLNIFQLTNGYSFDGFRMIVQVWAYWRMHKTHFRIRLKAVRSEWRDDRNGSTHHFVVAQQPFDFI